MLSGYGFSCRVSFAGLGRSRTDICGHLPDDVGKETTTTTTAAATVTTTTGDKESGAISRFYYFLFYQLTRAAVLQQRWPSSAAGAVRPVERARAGEREKTVVGTTTHAAAGRAVAAVRQTSCSSIFYFECRPTKQHGTVAASRARAFPADRAARRTRQCSAPRRRRPCESAATAAASSLPPLNGHTRRT